MNTQPEPLRLADALDAAPYSSPCTNDAAAELRRLHELNEDLYQQGVGFIAHITALQARNQELLEALKWIDSRCHIMLMDHPLHGIHKEMAHDAGACARAAIAKHGGEA